MEINKIYKGDSIEVLKTFPSESVDFIFADPPYYMQTEGELLRTDGTKFNGVEDEWDKFGSFQDYDNFTKQWLGECRRVLKKKWNNSCYRFISKYLSCWEYYARLGILDTK